MPTTKESSKNKSEKTKRKKADYDSRKYSQKLHDELCIQCMRYDMDRNPNDYVV